MERPRKISGPLAALHPSAIFFLLVACAVCFTLLVSSPWWRLTIYFFYLLLAALGGKTREYLKGMQKVLVLCLFIVIIQSLAFGDDVFLKLWIFAFKVEGLYRALTFSYFILLLGGAVLLYFGLINIYDWNVVLQQMGLPRLASYLLLSTVQMIPEMYKRSVKILEAQSARGIETKGNLFVRIRAWLPMFGPLLLGAIFATEERAVTLEARAFGRKGKSSFLYVPQRYPRDQVVKYASLLLMVVIIVLKVVRIWLK